MKMRSFQRYRKQLLIYNRVCKDSIKAHISIKCPKVFKYERKAIKQLDAFGLDLQFAFRLSRHLVFVHRQGSELLDQETGGLVHTRHEGRDLSDEG